MPRRNNNALGKPQGSKRVRAQSKTIEIMSYTIEKPLTHKAVMTPEVAEALRMVGLLSKK